MLSNAQWAVLGPLVEACRPHAKVPPSHLRRTVEAIIWRRTNGAKWRAAPAELGPWWKAAQIFIRWARLGACDRLLDGDPAGRGTRRPSRRASGRSSETSG
jgi:transposase